MQKLTGGAFRQNRAFGDRELKERQTQSNWRMRGQRPESTDETPDAGVDGDISGSGDANRGFRRPPRRARFISDPAELAQARGSAEGVSAGASAGETGFPNAASADGRGFQTERHGGDWEFPPSGIPPLMTTAPGYVPGPFEILERGGNG
jgi:hypothetical protein